MHWVVQENIFNERGYDHLVELLTRFDIPHTVVKVVPILHVLVPEVEPTGPTFAYGSTTLAMIAQRRGWQPGGFLNDNFDVRVWLPAYGEHALNADAVECRFGDVPKQRGDFFIRPALDDKSFNGRVYNWRGFQKWRESVYRDGTYTNLTADTRVAVASAKPIQAEYRCFIVDGRVATSSLYRRGHRVVTNVGLSAADPEAIEFATQMAVRFSPARAFVLDVATTEDGLRVIEVGNVGSAGLYGIDVSKWVQAIEALA